MLALSPAVAVEYHAPAIIFYGERKVLRFDSGEAGRAIVAKLRESRRLSYWLTGLATDLAAKIVSELHQNLFLVVDPTPSSYLDSEEYSKNAGWLALYCQDLEAAINALESARIAILGAGGIGSEVLRHLVGAGVRRYFLIDDDTVEPSNLNRQYLYGFADFGTPKSLAAKNAIARSHPLVAIDQAQLKVSCPEDLRVLDQWKPDLIVCAADTPIGQIERIVNEYASSAGIAWISGGAGLERGFWGPIFEPGKCPCFDCVDTVKEFGATQDRWVTELQPTRLESSFGPSNSIIAALMAKEILEWLTKSASSKSDSETVTKSTDQKPLTGGKRVLDLASANLAQTIPYHCRMVQ